jgi:hypothetical protein
MVLSQVMRYLQLGVRYAYHFIKVRGCSCGGYWSLLIIINDKFVEIEHGDVLLFAQFLQVLLN